MGFRFQGGAPAVLTALATAAAGLASNGTATFTLAPEYSNDLHWQSNWFFDAANGRGHLLYKSPGATTDYKHAIYDEATDTWSGPTVFNAQALGHIYGSTAFDPATGDLYFQSYGEKKVRRWTAATQSWDFETATFAIANTNTHPYSSLVWHPNLFGSGDGGLVLDCGYGTQPIVAWRKSTNTWSTVKANPTGTAGYTGVGAYLPALDAALVGGSNNASAAGILVGPGPADTAGAAFPLRLAGDSIATSGYGTVLPHPNNSNKFLMLQNGVNGAECHHSTDGVNWTQVSDHPLQDAEGGVFCSIPSLNIVWFIGRTTQSKLWKPPA